MPVSPHVPSNPWPLSRNQCVNAVLCFIRLRLRIALPVRDRSRDKNPSLRFLLRWLGRNVSRFAPRA